MTVHSLRQIKAAVKALDISLRAHSECSRCGKPTSGFIPTGQTRKQVGLCTCPPELTDSIDLELPIKERPTEQEGGE